jgi:hypothetical protein
MLQKNIKGTFGNILYDYMKEGTANRIMQNSPLRRLVNRRQKYILLYIPWPYALFIFILTSSIFIYFRIVLILATHKRSCIL